MKDNRLLTAVFAGVFAGHLVLLPLVSIILPERMSRTSLRPVVLLQPSAGPQPVTPVRKEPSPQLPRVRLVSHPRVRPERLVVRVEREVLREAPSERLGSDVLTFPVAMPEDLAVAVRRVSGKPDSVRMPESLTPPEGLAGPPSAGSPGFTFEITGLGGDRRVVFREPLAYPQWAQERGMEGNVRLGFSVAASGAVSRVELLVSSGYPELDMWVMDQFKKWRFNRVVDAPDVEGEIVFRLRIR